MKEPTPSYTSVNRPAPTLGIRYDAMSRPVRSYVDNLKAQVKQLMEKSGSTNVAELEVNANAGKVRLEDLRKIRDLMQTLAKVVRTGEMPPSPEQKALMEREAKALEAFFGTPIDVPPLPQEITPEKMEHWEKLGMELHYLPPMDMTKDKELPGWTKKPENWFYDEIVRGNISKDATKLPGSWILVDGRQKPEYQNGDQMYDHDPLAAVLADLNRRGLISQSNYARTKKLDVKSRFGLKPEDFENPEVIKAIAEALDLDPDDVSLPETIVWNVLANIHHPEWGTTNTAEWLKEKYGSGHRLCSGYSDSGGASYVHWRGDASDNVGFRPLGRFSP